MLKNVLQNIEKYDTTRVQISFFFDNTGGIKSKLISIISNK